jgi:hypothetical protein
VSEDDFGHGPGAAELVRPSKDANLRIILVDPTGQRPTSVWTRDGHPQYRETIVGRFFRAIRRMRQRTMVRTAK